MRTLSKFSIYNVNSIRVGTLFKCRLYFRLYGMYNREITVEIYVLLYQDYKIGTTTYFSISEIAQIDIWIQIVMHFILLLHIIYLHTYRYVALGKIYKIIRRLALRSWVLFYLTKIGERSENVLIVKFLLNKKRYAHVLNF